MRKRTVSHENSRNCNCMATKASLYHAVVVIFLEFFAFGLLTAPMIAVLDEAFPKHTFLMNGLIQGVKGFLSFLSAPLIGAMSDVFGRKPFLLLTVSFTCSPIPLLRVSHWWYFTMISISGIFSVTFSIIFAYVADVTKEEDRSWAYGVVSATFAASLVVSPTLGAYLGKVYSDNFVIALATAIALLDIFFVLACVPESLPDNYRVISASGKKISWEKADPFGALRKIGNDYLILILCIVVFLSFLPEAGQYSSFFVYLRLVVGFSEEAVALFIGFVGVVSCAAQTVLLSCLISTIGPKATIITGLCLETIQLTIYGLGRQHWMMWIAGGVAGLGSLTYPAISAFVSSHADVDQQGVAQGVLTGIRSLCNGLGPALFGFVFYLFQVDLTGSNEDSLVDSGNSLVTNSGANNSNLIENLHTISERLLPGPPFALGAVLVLIAIFVSTLIPKNPHSFMFISKRKGFGDNSSGSSYSALSHCRTVSNSGTYSKPSDHQDIHYVPISSHSYRSDSSRIMNIEEYSANITGTNRLIEDDIVNQDNNSNINNNNNDSNSHDGNSMDNFGITDGAVISDADGATPTSFYPSDTPPQSRKLCNPSKVTLYSDNLHSRLNSHRFADEDFERDYLSKQAGLYNKSAANQSGHFDISSSLTLNSDTFGNWTDRDEEECLIDSAHKSTLTVDSNKKKHLFNFPSITLLKQKENTITRGLRYLGFGSKQATS